MRKKSKVAEGWWDYTTLDDDLLNDAARLSADDLLRLSRPGFSVTISTIHWKSSILPKHWSMFGHGGTQLKVHQRICGPIGPTEQLPLVARLVK